MSLAVVVRLAARPDLAPVVAKWLWDEWWRDDGDTLADVSAFLATAVATKGVPQNFVLLVDGDPAGTASFVAHDLAQRSDLTPWLAGVFVAPAFRGRGFVRLLIEAVEAACRAAGFPRLWLYTNTAEQIYAKAGWQVTQRFELNGKTRALMARDFEPTT